MGSVFRRIRRHVRRKSTAKAVKARIKKAPPSEPKPLRPARTRVQEAQLRAKGGKHAERELICAEHGAKNTGRQWRRLRKKLSRQDRSEQRERTLAR